MNVCYDGLEWFGYCGGMNAGFRSVRMLQEISDQIVHGSFKQQGRSQGIGCLAREQLAEEPYWLSIAICIDLAGYHKQIEQIALPDPCRKVAPILCKPRTIREGIGLLHSLRHQEPLARLGEIFRFSDFQPAFPVADHIKFIIVRCLIQVPPISPYLIVAHGCDIDLKVVEIKPDQLVLGMFHGCSPIL